MQLVAYLNGERIDATQVAHEQWRALVDDRNYASLVLIECGLRASRVTLRGLQFFRHHRDVACSIEHKAESEQHLTMKRALKDKINAAAGWHAEVEHAHPERAWIADVMSIHISGKRLAFEVQLSPLSEDEYIRRSQRYADDCVGVVWIVPDNLDWFRIQMPMIVTGFGKTSALPEPPELLMDLAHFQPVFGKRASVGAALDAILAPSFRWPYGTPEHQLDEISKLEEIRAKAAAEHQDRQARLAEEKGLDEEKAKLQAEELAARFIASAATPAISAAGPVRAANRIWATEVRCLKAGHPMLIWRLTEPPPKRTSDGPMWRPTMENFDNVRAHVDTWLAVAGSSLAKAKVFRVGGWPVHRTFVCPECNQLIQGRWVSALPPAKWTLIAETSVSTAWARDVPYRKTPAQTTHTQEKAPAQRPPVKVEESDWRFIGPRRKPNWITEAGSEELPYFLVAKKAHAERMEQLRASPRYRVSPNGFRFECADCGGEFEDEKEGIHADGGCLILGARGLGGR
ncbi:competence protein CoiA [Arthrobacter sp. 18067]|uniref:competence protein CoiA n=1 Tax=Arthrobacter sp. 18067 TaxID=2681413 RepID=UPI0013581C5E|nr:competence protein CoiA family protein [Arthrobacter sp. 18067]